jgi:hypothetical protein
MSESPDPDQGTPSLTVPRSEGLCDVHCHRRLALGPPGGDTAGQPERTIRSLNG